MTNLNNQERTLSLLAEMASLYDVTPSKSALKITLKYLSGFTDEQLEIAFKSHVLDPERGRFYPRVADIAHQVAKLPKKPRLFHQE